MEKNRNNQLNLNRGPKKSISKMAKDFIDNTKKAVRDTVAATGIAVSTLVPSSVESLTALAPAVTLPTAAALITACERPDMTPPTIDIAKPTLEISGGELIRITGSQLYIGNNLVASWHDDVTSNCSVSITMNGKAISASSSINESGTISIKVTDEAGNTKNASVKVNILNNAPVIELKQSEVNVYKGKVVSIEGNKLIIGGDTIATWSDDKTQNCKISLTLNAKEVKSGDTLKDAGTLVLTVTDGEGKSSTANIKLNVTDTNNAPEITIKQSQITIFEETTIKISGNKLLIGDSEIASRNDDSTENCTVSLKFNGKEIKSGDAINETGTLSIIISDAEGKSSTKDISIIKEVIQYQGVPITYIKPTQILPFVGQVEDGDPKAYEHIEHLRIAEATRIRDMMWKYGTGKHSPEQYQQLMSRLNTGMTYEIPLGDDNYEILGVQEGFRKPSNHAHAERSILNNLIKHANFKLILGTPDKWNDRDSRQETAANYIKDHPNSINIFGNSSYPEYSNKKDYELSLLKDDILKLCDSKQFIIFAAGTNITVSEGGILKNKIYNGEYEADQNGLYGLGSMAKSNKNNYPNSHLLVTIATDADGDVDQTGDTESGGSKYPVGFANNILFSGRTFPYHSQNTGGILAGDGKYATSIPNYLNVAIMDLCFQMFAEVKDVNELLEMVRSTCDTDYIRLDGQTQELQLMNPAKFFKKYLMPDNIPSSIQSGEVKALDKGYYKGVIFDIPGAEVKINGQWIAYNKSNESLIKSQNPMTLEWRINTDEAMKYGNSNLKGKVVVVDDQRNGLNMEKEINITINQYGGKMANASQYGGQTAKINQHGEGMPNINQSSGEIAEIKIFS